MLSTGAVVPVSRPALTPARGFLFLTHEAVDNFTAHSEYGLIMQVILTPELTPSGLRNEC